MTGVQTCALPISILKKKRKQLDLLANALIEYETLSGEDINNLLEGKLDLPKA